MLKLAVEKGVRSRVEVLPSTFSRTLHVNDSLNLFAVTVKDAGKALKGLEEGKPRYRYVLKFVFYSLLFVTMASDRRPWRHLGLISERHEGV